jgi:hypothetical protein
MSISRAKRWRLSYDVQLASPDYVEGAKTVDLSLRGLCIATKRAIPRGTHLYIRLLLPDRRRSVVGRLFIVRWSVSGRVGMEATEAAPGDESRLLSHLTSVEGTPEPVFSGSPTALKEGPISKYSDAFRTAWGLLVEEIRPFRDPGVPYSTERPS